MKVPFISVRLSALAGAGLLAGILLCSMSLRAQVKPAEGSALPNFDNRTSLAPSAGEIELRKNALANLQGLLPVANVSVDPLLNTPKFVRARTGFLTGANGEGLAVSPQAAAEFPVSDPLRGVKAFLNQHASLYGHGAEALQSATIARDSVTAHNGLRTVVWQQRLDGLPVMGSVIIGNVAANGALVSISGGFVPNAPAAADAGTPNRGVLQVSPTVSSAAAVSAAAQNLGETLGLSEISASGRIVGDGYAEFQALQSVAHARQVWLPLNQGNLRLCWDVLVTSQVTRRLYQMVVDAETGAVLVRRNLSHNISDATYNVYTGDSPAPWTPGPPNPSAVQAPFVNRTLLTLSALDVNASPNGWINDGDNDTQGNNVDAFVDRDFDQQPDGGQRTQGAPPRVFDFPLDVTQDPVTYSNAASVQLFYLINWYHDRLYQFGFTEAQGNFQNDNFGRGGLGNDRVIGLCQAGADVGAANNAFFSTPPDGINGLMAMFIFDFPTPARDGDLDAEIVFHEATHGLSWRMVAGGQALGTLQSDGMGEGWSDFYALCLLSEPSDDPDGVYSTGGYATYQFAGLAQNYYFGIRHFPYSTDLNKNPFTFKDIDPTQISPHAGVPRSPIYPFNPQEASEVHHQGEIWCVMLWEVRANLVRRLGPAGNDLMVQLVTDAMKLTPAAPTFVEARDAILLADQVNNGGANYLDIWQGFAKRGLGFSASAPPSTTTTGVVEAFDVPGLQLATVMVSGGNGNGFIDFNECNDLFVVLTNLSLAGLSNVQMTISTTTPEVAIGVRNSPYPDLPAGAGGTNLLAFTLSTTPIFICGTAIELDVLIKSDELTSRTTLTLTTGAAGAPKRFDSTDPVAIADADPAGTNSVISVSNLVSAIRELTVSLYLTHTFDADLYFELIGPDGTRVLLSDHNGGGGNNYGANCEPDTFRTTFDDDSTAPISGGAAPFVGVFRPQQPLAAFIGKSGTNANGDWRLHVVDDVGFDVGVLQCWSLYISTATCTDGGGTCPGAELAIGLQDSPDPVFLGSNLVYTISVTNHGPSQATNIVVNQLLPPSVVFASAQASQGSVSHAGGTVIGNIGTLPFGAKATITVTVIPTLTTVISSTATVSSEQPDPNTANNTAVATSQVNPPASDVTVGLLDSPDPVLLGEPLTYTVAVTNKGPSTATGVTVTNTLPVSVLVQSATPSQGSAIISGNIVVMSFGTLTNGGSASGTIAVTPTAEGAILATAVARANQADPQPVNNNATATTVVGPAANLSVTMTDAPDPVVVRSNWTYSITVTNFGPSPASGAVVNHTLPSGVNVVSSSTTSGTISGGGGVLTVNLGTLASGAGAAITVTVNATNTGTYQSSVSATAAQADAHPEDNAAQTSTLVALPFVSVVAAGATLTEESYSPPDGGLAVGETVTVQLRLRNAGNVNNTNLTATLLATGGVTLPSPAGPASYGVLPPGGLPVSMPFTFTANGTNGGTVVATLQLQDGGNDLGSVTYNFTLPTVNTFSNTAAITIPDSGNASPYPSTITVAGVTGLVGKVTATLSNFTHTFPQDLDVLLVGPGGAKSILMASAGGAFASDVNVTFDDGAAFAIPAGGTLASGSYRPASYGAAGSLPAPAPGSPYPVAMTTFNGINPNGPWSLYIVDRSGGDFGNVAGGWSLSLAVVSPVNQVSDLGVVAAAVPNPVLVADNVVTTFTITNTGPDEASGVSFTNLVPAGAILVSASASQGLISTNGSSVTGSLGAINVGSSVTVTVVFRPGVAGVLAISGNARSSQTDLNPANNTGSVNVTVNAPVADLTLGAVASTNAMVLGSNITYTVSVTNLGPQQALGVLVTDAFPSGLNFVSTTAGNFTNNAGTLTVGLGDLAPGGFAEFDVVANATGLGNLTNVISAGTTSVDTNAVNNAETLAVLVSLPAPIVVADNAMLTAESVSPPNATVDIGETVTVALSLKNVGSASTANLIATLQASGGVVSPSGPQNYGALAVGGGAVARSYSFTAGGTNGGVIVATLQLQDGTNNLGTTAFAFQLPGTSSFTNAAVINIPGQGGASTYPSTIQVSGLLGQTATAVVTLNGLTHGFPDDLDILLVSPTGQRVMLMSDAGGGHAITNRVLTFNDSGAPLPDTATIFSGTYKPTDYEIGDVLPPPAPAGTTGPLMASFNGADPNGAWSLYVADDSAGDGGSISNGWSLTLTTISAVNPLADLALSMTGTPATLYVGSGLTYNLSVVNHGPAAASDVTVTDTLPSGVIFVSATTSQGTFTNAGGVVTFNLGTLSSSASASASIQVSPAFGGSLINSATVGGAESDLSTVNNTAQTTTTVLVPLRATLSGVVVTNAELQFTLTGDPGMSYVIQGSTNLTTWTPLSTNTAAVNGTIKFTDSNAPGFNQRFYRAVRVIP